MHAQGPQVADATPVKIERMIRGIFDHEKNIKTLESQKDADALRSARIARDEHIAVLRHLIDYALNDAAFTSSPCPDCQMPADAAGFIAQFDTFKRPAMACQTCEGVGALRTRKTDAQSAADHKRISHFKRALDDTIRCAKIRAGGSEANQAYLELEKANIGLIHKFGNENQTSLEGEDALQGARHGLVDAAMRFDPTRKEGAMFATVAYNWCLRNSRARHHGQKRAGIYAPSVDAMVTHDSAGREAPVTDLLASADGAFGSFAPSVGVSDDVRLDVETGIAKLPEMERKVITLSMSGLTHSEIAKQLGVSRTDVSRYQRSAYARLRESLADYLVNSIKE